ncbi:hypothetical protein FRC11_009480 [Ceratobasidium sp. 423]|nr:hypothetical protein FRC11_009480 [Ceratobasidium sp. 423]
MEGQLVTDKIITSRRIVIVTGAGISRAAGLRDFRSEDGLYRSQQLSGGPNPKDILHIDSLGSESGIRHLNSLLHTMWLSASTAMHTTAHTMIALLHRMGHVMRYFTQNIDGLDESLGLLPTEPHGAEDDQAVLMQLHGSLRWLKCNKCHWREPLTKKWWDKMRHSETHLACPACPQESRSGRPIQGGYVRTDILLYGEPHPYSDMVAAHFKYEALHQPDLLLIMGTSLDTGSSTSLLLLVKDLSKSIRSHGGTVVYINKELPPKPLCQHINHMLTGDLQVWATHITSKLHAQGVSQGNTCPSEKLPPTAGHRLIPFLQSTNNILSSAAVTPIQDLIIIILLFTVESTMTARALRQCLHFHLRQSNLPHVFWYLQIDQFQPLDPDMFG